MGGLWALKWAWQTFFSIKTVGATVRAFVGVRVGGGGLWALKWACGLWALKWACAVCGR